MPVRTRPASSGWISGHCRGARWWCGPWTARNSAAPSTITATASWICGCPPPASRCRRIGRCRTRRTTGTCCARRCQPRSPPPGSTRPASSASAPTSPRARSCRCWRTAPRCASCRTWPGARTPTSNCGSITRPSRRRTGSTPSRISAGSRGSPATAERSPPSGSSPRDCSCWRRIWRSTSGRSAGSRPPTGSSGSCAGRRPATPAQPGTRVSGRTVITHRGSSSRRSTRNSRASPTTSWPTPSPRSGPGQAR